MSALTTCRKTSSGKPLRAVCAVGAMITAMLVGFAGPGSGAPSQPREHLRTEPGDVRPVSTGWTTPWGLSWLPDASALISQRDSSEIFRVTRDGVKTLLGTVPETVANHMSSGVLGIAASPSWETDHYVYIMHTSSDGNRIARMTYNGSALGDYRILLTGIRAGTIHNGGRLEFGPDGYLYATTGDSEQPSTAQDKNSLNGKILRLTTDGNPAPGNPFNTYVYSYGHRNSEGLAWDEQGHLWASEFGERYDELNLIEPGGNYGWPSCEGPCTAAGMTSPKAYWSPWDASPSGLTYADGNLYMAALQGRRLWRIPVSGTDTGTPAAYYTNQYGRLRTVEKVPGSNALWMLTSNTDQVGTQPAGSDRLLEAQLQ